MSSDESDGDMGDVTVNFNYKIILVGNSQVGKTSITARYVENTCNTVSSTNRNKNHICISR